MTVINTAKAVVALQRKPQSVTTLSKEVGLSENTAYRMISALRELGFIEFKAHGEPRESGGHRSAFYGWKQ